MSLIHFISRNDILLVVPVIRMIAAREKFLSGKYGNIAQQGRAFSGERGCAVRYDDSDRHSPIRFVAPIRKHVIC